MYPDYLGPQYGPMFNYNFRGGPPFGARFYGPWSEGQPQGGSPQPLPFEPGSPPPGGPGGPPGGQPSGPPSGQPPAYEPQKKMHQSYGAKAIEPRTIMACRFRYVYLWLDNEQQFWAWLTYVGRFSASGWRWTGTRWVYFGIGLREIAAFSCY